VVRRSAKSAIALLFVFIFGWTPLQRLLSITSAEATVNARVITIRAPIDGRIVDWQPKSGVGSSLQSGTALLKIENARADRSRLDELRRQESVLISQHKAAVGRLVELNLAKNEQFQQFTQFRQHRIAHIEARRNEIVADIEAAKARQEVANLAFTRASSLYDRGVQTQRSFEEITREQKVAEAVLASLERRLEAATVELVAARSGTFVTDGFNDIPRSAQRANELEQVISEVKFTVSDLDRRIEDLKTDIAAETLQYRARSEAQIASPASGEIWELLTSPGEDIYRGQELMRVLDCKAMVVTAAVSEANFNKLRVGDKATFRLRASSEELPGRVVGLFGLASVPANLAINHATLKREPFHATVEVPALSQAKTCQVGRTGIVSFDPASE
jgi:multidrug resistance efflux pump